MSTALEFKNEAVALSNRTESDSGWLGEIRQRARTQFADLPLPTRKTENWRYTPLANALVPEIAAAARPMPVSVERINAQISLRSLPCTRLVFVNGHFNEALSDIEAGDGIKITRFAAADADARESVQSTLGTLVDAGRHPFSALNASLLNDGVLVEIAAGARIEKPVHLVWYQAAQSAPFTATCRLLWKQGENSEATLIEHFCDEDSTTPRFSTAISEIHLGDNAGLTHYRLQLESGAARHVGGLHLAQGRDSRFDSHQIAMGSHLKRFDLEVWLRESGAQTSVRGIYLAREDQHVDNHSNMQHVAGHCHSEAVFKGIVDDKARAVFDGRIHIHEQAQKTEAHLTNRNLLLSNRAEVNTKPELEIYADDVKCSHGATVGQLNHEALFYLRARGIDATKARAMLSVGFVNELLNAMPHEAIRQLLEPDLAEFFGDRETVDRLLQL